MVDYDRRMIIRTDILPAKYFTNKPSKASYQSLGSPMMTFLPDLSAIVQGCQRRMARALAAPGLMISDQAMFSLIISWSYRLGIHLCCPTIFVLDLPMMVNA
jgi:hypothetical protein